MARSVFRTVLVIGDNHEEIIKKYSADTAVEPYVKYRRDDAAGMLEKHISIIKEILENPHMTLTERQREVYKDLYLDLKSMDDFDYYLQISDGCIYDEENGDAISTVNPNAYYRSEACYEKRFQATGEEAPFSNPFKLKNGKQSYSARLSDIDWEKNHMFNTEIYRAAWELVVEDRDPQNEREEHIKNNMSNRLAYFQNFTDVDEYIRHSCSFWTYGIAFEDRYEEVSYEIHDKTWVAEFFDKYIKTLEGNPLLTIYEVRSLNE